MTDSIWKNAEMPFVITMLNTSRNPAPFPDVLPFEVIEDSETGVLVQKYNKDVDSYLARAYEIGSEIGPAMDDEQGLEYAQDFIRFINEVFSSEDTKKCLEIGAGRGYLVKHLNDTGFNCIGLEPGEHHKESWKKYGVEIIHDMFPSELLAGEKFDLLTSYNVLEHIHDDQNFMLSIKESLSHDGLVVMAVPDVETYLLTGDPSAFVHEHYKYFTRFSLKSYFEYFGANIVALEKSRYGSELYIAARFDNDITTTANKNSVQTEQFTEFSAKCTDLNKAIERRLYVLEREGKSLGIYCPSRCLNIIPTDREVRFFDDNAELLGKYYPAFNVKIENMDSLINRPVDELWIMSRSFGDLISKKIKNNNRLSSLTVIQVDELVSNLF